MRFGMYRHPDHLHSTTRDVVAKRIGEADRSCDSALGKFGPKDESMNSKGTSSNHWGADLIAGLTAGIANIPDAMASARPTFGR